MTTMSHGVIFGMLGPVRVWSVTGALTVAEPRRRAVLVALLLDAGRTVPMPRLVRLVWGDAHPPTERKAVQVYVSKLRQTLAAVPEVRLATQPGGYRLDCPPEAVDLHWFRRLVTDAHRASLLVERRDRLREALDLWRGAPFADAATDALQEAVAPALEEERLSALEELFAVQIRLGEQTRVIGPLMSAIAEHPTRERLTELLMTALREDGRQADAAQAYRRLYARLARETGLAPNDRLEALHRSVLGGATGSAVRPRGRPDGTTDELIREGTRFLAAGDRDRAVASFYAARAYARDTGDEDGWRRACRQVMRARAERRGTPAGRPPHHRRTPRTPHGAQSAHGS
jgi:DNA-binding SARP family transcriptional activator